MTEFVFDIEANGLNPDKIHCLCTQDGSRFTQYDDMIKWLSNLTEDDILIGHNIIQYDVLVLERILGITVRAKLVDTLALSWYLFPYRVKHGLADWGEEFGIPKPKVDDWENLTTEEYVHRCTEDVKINTKLWEVIKKRLTDLYGGEDNFWGVIEYLTFKMQCARLQEENKWRLDVEGAKELLSQLEAKQEKATKELEKVMPKVPVYVKRKRPAKPYKKDGSLSTAGLKWKQICEENDIDFDSKEEFKVISGYKEPNANSSSQIKDWLFSLGWQPETYKFVKSSSNSIKEGDNERKIPQIKKGDEICPSILKMDIPELDNLKELGVLSHRIGIVKGFLRDEVDGYIIAGVQGLTNTLRFKHKTCVNIPSSRAPYGKEIRSLLLAEEGRLLCGSDMSNLEGRIKEHYVYPYDLKFVESINKDGYDGHLAISVQSGMMTEDEAEFYKWYKKQN